MEQQDSQVRDIKGRYSINSSKKIKRLQFLRKGKKETSSKIGRRIIDIDYFGKEFDSGCRQCGEQFMWKNLNHETVFGVCSALHFSCGNCSSVTRIYTSTLHSANSKSKRKPFSVNVKAALGNTFEKRDEDSSAMKHIREKVNSDVEKFSDLTHIKRSISNKLQDISKTHASLTEKVRQAFVKNFIYAVHQNKVKGEEELQAALRCIVPHMFGDHLLCGKWCGHGNPAYRHSNLPYGKDLSDMSLKDALTNILEPFIKHPSKLMTSGNSQANESLNNTIFSKAPKIRNYNLSESFDFRCAAGVLQFNQGTTYIETVIGQANLSPRKETTSYTTKEDKKRKYMKTYKNERKNKKRRIELKQKRKQKELTSDIKLGTCYEKDCAMNFDDIDTFEIQDPPNAIDTRIECNPEDIETIFMDIETTKFGYEAELTQIGAYINDKSFETYILPESLISQRASEITGLKVKAVNGSRMMYKNERPVEAICTKEALIKFIQWLEEINVNEKKQILCAHNGSRFDFPILYKALELHQLLTYFKAAISGVVDSMKVIKSVLPKQVSLSLANIYSELFGTSFENHDATADAKALGKIFTKLEISSECVLNSTEQIESSVRKIREKINQRANINRLQMNLSDGQHKKVITDNMAGKMIQGGVSIEVLMLAYNRDKERGVKTILAEKIDGKVRVTNRRSIINDLTEACRRKSVTH